jgi:hypothetical protein
MPEFLSKRPRSARSTPAQSNSRVETVLVRLWCQCSAPCIFGDFQRTICVIEGFVVSFGFPEAVLVATGILADFGSIFAVQVYCTAGHGTLLQADCPPDDRFRAFQVDWDVKAPVIAIFVVKVPIHIEAFILIRMIIKLWL